MNYLKISIGIFLALAASRLIPHPPNFTNLIALSFYVPAFFGVRYIPAVILAFMFTDAIIGFHDTMIYTFLSVALVGIISKYFLQNFKLRFLGLFIGSIIFYLLTNLGVWLTGYYGHTVSGLILCYYLALPFFYGTILSSILYGILIESLLKLGNRGFLINLKLKNIN
tara:strand:- start:92 stop:595 length:504 start_codon:yes stop_codon:yes gene_type:complete